jgi:hypothetical protein
MFKNAITEASSDDVNESVDRVMGESKRKTNADHNLLIYANSMAVIRLSN